MSDKPAKDDQEREEETEDCNVEGKSLVDLVTGQRKDFEADELIGSDEIKESLKRLKSKPLK